LTHTEVNWRFGDRYSLDRARPFASWITLGFFLIGCAFWIEARLSGEGFSPELFGDFAYRFPAEMWAFAMMAGSAITYIGLIKPMRWHMVAIGAGINATQFMGLAYSAIFTGGEIVVGLHASVLFAPCYMWIMIRAVQREW